MNTGKNIREKQKALGMAWIWHVILILYILFIYSNSMRPAVQSSAESGRVLRLLQKLAADTGIAVPWLTEHIVRKCAHFIEYTGLGILLRQSALCVRVNGAILEEMWTEDPADGKDRTGRMRAMAPCGSVWLEIHRIAIFAVPFLDETIQLFTEGRSGQLSDVWLDMAGALTGTVLYLALEDDYRRLQERLYRMFGTESTDNLYFSVSASQLGNGLDEQLARFVAEHKDTKLIIIDTLQKVREVGGDNYSYANDYQIMARLKSFADAHGLCILLVHHTRKQTADDKFDMISGTSGLLGAADGAFLLQKEKRTGNAATLEVSGRDQQDQKLYLVRNTETLLWELQRAETELWKEPPEPLLDEIAELVMKDISSWEGSATELVSLIKVEIQPHVITRKLNILSGRLYAEHGIYYKNNRTHDGRKIRFWKDDTETA